MLADATSTEFLVLPFANCTVRVWPHTRYLETVFPDGTKVPAAPNHTEEDIARAHSLGYGGDTWRMSLEHEILHTYLAEKMGQPWSWTLWWVAHKSLVGKPPRGMMSREEDAVLAFQGYTNRHATNLRVIDFGLRDGWLAEWVEEARELLKRVGE